MRLRSEEEKYKKLFQRLKRKDESNVPSFDSVWQAALAKTEKTDQTWCFPRFAIAAVLMIALISSVVFYNSHRQAQTIGQWRAPTNSLLISPGEGLLLVDISFSKPKIGEPLSDWESPTALLLNHKNFDIK